MKTTLLQIAIILTATAPLQAEPTTQPSTQTTGPVTTLCPTVDEDGKAYLVFSPPADRITELEETIDTQNKKIECLRKSLDNTKPYAADATAAITNIESMYNRALFWMLTLFGVLVAAITILAVLICAVLPIVAARRERERQSKQDKALEDTQKALTDAQETLVALQYAAEKKLLDVEKTLTEKVDAHRQELENQIAHHRTDLDKSIEEAKCHAMGGIYKLEGNAQIRANNVTAAIHAYILAIYFYVSGNAAVLATTPAEQVLSLKWPKNALAPMNTSPYSCWRALDLAITAIEEDTTGEIKPEVIADLKTRRKQFGPEAFDNIDADKTPEEPAEEPETPPTK
jgi:hypothetical protein